jgi:hypothetical protein
LTRQLEPFSNYLERFRARGAVAEISETETTPKVVEHNNDVQVANQDGEKTPIEVRGVKLPYFPDDKLCVPNELARSGLFPPTNKIEYVEDPLTKKIVRVRYTNLPVPSWSKNVEIYYTGSQVTMFDGHVWYECVSRAKNDYLGTIVRFTAYDLCKSLGLGDGKNAYDLAYDSIERLFQASLKIKVFKQVDGKRKIIKEYNDHFISSFEVDKVTKEYLISLNPRLANLYACETTWIDRELLNSIRSSVGRALLIHGYSHEATSRHPQFMPLEKVLEVTNIKSPLREFRRTHKKLEKEFIEKGVFKKWTLKDDIITVVRPSGKEHQGQDK